VSVPLVTLLVVLILLLTMLLLKSNDLHDTMLHCMVPHYVTVCHLLYDSGLSWNMCSGDEKLETACHMFTLDCSD